MGRREGREVVSSTPFEVGRRLGVNELAVERGRGG